MSHFVDESGYQGAGSDLGSADTDTTKVNKECGPGRYFDGESTKKNKFKTMTPESDYKSNLGSSN